ncbi:MAG: T9SS type A sorting domain-containing protein, partial [Ginsengibacter sp.]
TGTFTVTRTVDGCRSGTGSGTTAPNAQPSAPVVTVTNNCGSSTLSTTATGTLLWSTGENSSSITVIAAGTYTVSRTIGTCTSAVGSGVAAPKNPPAITATDINVSTTLDNCGASVSFGSNVTVTGTPAPTIVYKIGTVVITSPYVFPGGTSTVTVSATNSCTTATTTFLVGVSDNQSPSITCKPGATETADGSSTYTVSGAEFDATATDNCGTPSLVYSLSGATTVAFDGANTSLAGKPLNVGTTTITWTATDANDNVTTCSTVVTVTANGVVAPALVSKLQGENRVSEPKAVSFTVKVMPNPTTTYFTLQFNSPGYEKLKITVIDITGRVVEQNPNVPANSTLQIGNSYHPGVYIAEILQGKNKIVLRLIKEGN